MRNLTKKLPDFSLEKSYLNQIVVGIDEAGRGPLAGPIVAACILLDEKILQNKICAKINDSKKLSKKDRKEIFLFLQDNAQFGLGVVSEKKIDEINIYQATKLAMHEAYKNFCAKNAVKPHIILVDGNFVPFAKQDEIIDILAIIKGDAKSLSIAAASIIAKETRDSIMLELHEKYPHYGWDKNAAYATEFHMQKIKEFGFCEFHRKSFEPIKSMIYSI